MNLSYRGNRYNRQAIHVSTVDTGANGQFLGQPYSLRQPLQTANRANAPLTYRGVAY